MYKICVCVLQYIFESLDPNGFNSQFHQMMRDTCLQSSISSMTTCTIFANVQTSIIFCRMHDGGEVDVRACYTAISVSVIFLVKCQLFLWLCIWIPMISSSYLPCFDGKLLNKLKAEYKNFDRWIMQATYYSQTRKKNQKSWKLQI